MKLSGKSAIVTGGGSGIGEGISHAFAQNGAKVAVADLSLERAQGVVDQIRSAGGQATALECDVTVSASVGAMTAARGKTEPAPLGALTRALKRS